MGASSSASEISESISVQSCVLVVSPWEVRDTDVSMESSEVGVDAGEPRTLSLPPDETLNITIPWRSSVTDSFFLLVASAS